MKRGLKIELFMIHAMLLALAAIVLFAPKARDGLHLPAALFAALGLIEGIFLMFFIRKRKMGLKAQGICDIMLFVWLVFIAWELFTSVTGAAHPVLIPAPENVFFTFYEHWQRMLMNVAYSMELLLIGFSAGMIASVLLGLFVGWIPRLREFFYPIANVMAPIPAVVFSPYLVSLMPSFRSASAVVIFLGVFWPSFLSIINRVQSIEPRILDSARMLRLNNGQMIFSVLLPYVLPGVVSGLRVSVTTSLLMLNFAELMGATHGLGYYVQNSITYANYTHAVAGIICIGVVVTALGALVALIQKKAVRWR